MSDDSWTVVAAVSAVFHQDSRYQKFYDDYGPLLGGFPGLWGLCRDAGLALDGVLSHHEDSTYDYIDTVDLFVDLIYNEEPDEELPDHILTELANHAVETNKYIDKGG